MVSVVPSPVPMKNILFVDSAVLSLDPYINAETAVIGYNSGTTTTDEMTQRFLSVKTDTVDRIGFAFHYSDPILFLNREPFFTDSDLGGAQQDLVLSRNFQFMLDLLFVAGGGITNIDFLACDTLQNEKWKLFYQLLQLQTGVVVGASVGLIYFNENWTSSLSSIPPPPLVYDIISLPTSEDFSRYKNICFISYLVKNSSTFSQYLNSETYPVIYNDYSDREHLKTVLLSQFTAIERISFVFHGPPPDTATDFSFVPTRFIHGEMFFTKDETTGSVVVGENHVFIQELCNTLHVRNVDFLGCNLLQSTLWKNYLNLLQNVVVGASDNNTGNLLYGGDWVMESTMEDIRDVYFTTAIDNYTSLLYTALTSGNISTAVNLWYSDNAQALTTYGPISQWDVTGVMGIRALFYAKTISDDLSQWDTRNITDMIALFQNATFTATGMNLSSWNTSNVVDMNYMFYQSNFTGDISGWDVRKVTDMHQMFQGSSFNGDISQWKTTNVTTMEYMFYNASQFNQDLSGWDVAKVTNMGVMFYNAVSFNSDLSEWEVPLISAQPSNFKAGATLFTNTKFTPHWGKFRLNPIGSRYINIAKDSVYTDAGVSDSYPNIITTSNVNTAVVGNYTVEYNVTAANTGKTQPSYQIRYVSVYVFKTPVISALPTAITSVTYPAPIGTVSLSSGRALTAIGGADVSGTFSISSTISNLVFNANTYFDVSATFIPDSPEYLSVPTTVPSITVSKATPVLVARPYATISYPKTLNSAEITGGSVTATIGGIPISGTYAVVPILSNTIYRIGTYQDISAIFTPASSNYSAVATTIATLTVTIGHTYFNTFYTVSATTPTTMTRTIYDNVGSLVETEDISFGGMNIADVLSLMDGGGTNPYTIGIVDSSLNKISMDTAYVGVYTKALTTTQQSKLMTYVNDTYKEPHTYMTAIYTVTFSDGVFVLKNQANVVMTYPISLSGGSVYMFDQSDGTNAGNTFRMSSTTPALTEITSGVTTNSTPGSLNSYIIVSPSANISVYSYSNRFYYYVKVGLNILSQPVFLISTSLNGTYYSQMYLSFTAGNKYTFYVSDPSVATYNMVFGSDGIANTSLYTVVGTPGVTAGAYVLLDVSAGYAGATIQYFEQTRSGMGYSVPVVAVLTTTVNTLTWTSPITALTDSEVYITTENNILTLNAGTMYYSLDGGASFLASDLSGGDRLYIHNNKFGVMGTGIYPIWGGSTKGFRIFQPSSPATAALVSVNLNAIATHGHAATLYTADPSGNRLCYSAGWGNIVTKLDTRGFLFTNVGSFSIDNSTVEINDVGTTIFYSLIISNNKLICAHNNVTNYIAMYTKTSTSWTLSKTITTYTGDGGSMNLDDIRHLYCSGNGKYLICIGSKQVSISNDFGESWFKIRSANTYTAVTNTDNIFSASPSYLIDATSLRSSNKVYCLSSLSFDGKYISVYTIDFSYYYRSSDYGNTFSTVNTPVGSTVVSIAEGSLFSLVTTKIGSTHTTRKTSYPTTMVTYTTTISGGLVYLDGIANPVVSFQAGSRYIFNQSAASNANNQIVFSTSSSGNPMMTSTDGVTIVGTPGQSGAYTKIDVSGGFTGTLYYLLYNNIQTFSSITSVGKFYFNADSTANYTSDASSNVTRWKNKISGGLDASANRVDATGYPKIVTNIPGSGTLPFMKLAGTADQIGFNYNGGAISGNETNQQTFFMFGYMYGINANTFSLGMFFSKPGPYGTSNTLHIGWDDYNTPKGLLSVINYVGNVYSTNPINNYVNGSFTPGYYMMSITVDCSGGTTKGTVNIQAYSTLNTIDDGSVNKELNAQNRITDLHNFNIGYWDGGGSRRSLNSAIGEVMYFNRILSKNERYILEGKIAWKYGQASILPATHPYKTSSPIEYTDSFTYTTTISGGLVHLDGSANRVVSFQAGNRYIFNQSAASNANNQIVFSTYSDGDPMMTAGVTIVGTPGQTGAYTRLDVPGTFAGTLYYLSILSVGTTPKIFSVRLAKNVTYDISSTVGTWTRQMFGVTDANFDASGCNFGGVGTGYIIYGASTATTKTNCLNFGKNSFKLVFDIFYTAEITNQGQTVWGTSFGYQRDFIFHTLNGVQTIWFFLGGAGVIAYKVSLVINTLYSFTIKRSGLVFGVTVSIAGGAAVPALWDYTNVPNIPTGHDYSATTGILTSRTSSDMIDFGVGPLRLGGFQNTGTAASYTSGNSPIESFKGYLNNFSFYQTVFDKTYCVLWFDASTMSGFADNTTLTTANIVDKSSRARTVARIGNVKYNSSGLGTGKPGLTLTTDANTANTSGIHFNMPANTFLNTSGSGAISVFIVLKVETGATYPTIWTRTIGYIPAFFDMYSSQGNISIDTGATKPSMVLANVGGMSTPSIFYMNISYNTSTLIVSVNEIIYNSSNGTTGTSYPATPFNNSFTSCDIDTGTMLTIGAREDNITGLNGVVSEGMVFNTTLSNTDRDGIVTYLKNKWGI